MATGNYGTIRPADVSIDDVEIFYSYTPNRESLTTVELQSLDPAQVLIPANNPNNVSEIFGGLYTLKLPTSVFGSKGFYSIVIRPKQIRTTIQDCGVLIDNQDVKGIVFDINQIPLELQNRFENGNLVGYRVEYIKEQTGTGQDKIQNLFRIITSNNRALPISQNQGNSNASQAYTFNDNSTSLFCTVSPSSAPSVSSASQQKATMEVKKMEFSSSKGEASSQRSQRSPTEDQQVQMNETVAYFESFAPESFEYHYFKYVAGNYTIGLVDHLFKAEKLKPNNADVQIQLASYYIITGDRLNSVKYLAKLKAIDRISDVSLKYAKDVLLSVPENGVLITHGFDDTYACEYLQLLDNQRTDVTIISLDFLQSREYAKKLKEKGFNVSESTVIDVTYFTALCNQNEAKKISISLTTPKEYFKSIQTNLFVVGLVFEYHSNQFNNYYKNDYLWNEVLEKSLVYSALNEKGKEISSNYLPMLLQLRTFYIQNDEVEKLKEIEIALDKVSVQSKKYDKVQKLKKSY